MLWKMWCFALQSMGHTNHKLCNTECSNAPEINCRVTMQCHNWTNELHDYIKRDTKTVARGGSLGSEEPPKSGKGPLECTKRSTRLHKKVHYRLHIKVHCVINDATVEELNKFCYPIS